jgi:hypothetical protein
MCKRTWPYFCIYQDKRSDSESKKRKKTSRKFVRNDVYYAGSKREREKKEKSGQSRIVFV